MDPYKILGVDRGATPEDIKAAYRKLANKHHPDRGGDTKLFQEIQGAYDILSNPEKRAAFDNPHPQFREYHGGANPFAGFGPFQDFNPFQDIFNQFMGGGRQKIYTVQVFVTLEQIVKGSVENIQINTPHGPKLVQLDIPKNIEDGSQVRYEGIMPDGVLQVLFRIHQHPKFQRRGLDLYSTHKVNIFELITGTKTLITDIHGKQVEMVIPAMTKPGTKFRLPGKGITEASDHYVLIEPILPDNISVETLEQIKREVERVKI